MKKKAYVGLSGGVDSSVSAALLQERGYAVTGVFIKIWQPEFIECSWREDRLDAMRVAAQLGIPFSEIDLSDAYKKEVVERMIATYRAGVTPNPDVLCNTMIKFGAFMRYAMSEGADVVATGHYARIACQGETLTLQRGKDANKDQSYFLHELTSEQLRRIVFPVGDLEKRTVREKAVALGLPVARKPDSQGLCFVGDITLPDFLAHYMTLTPGPVLDMSGREVGEHDGALRYTIGQRHGFKLSVAGGVPHYVIATDASRNTVNVSPDQGAARAREIMVRDMHWIGERPLLDCDYLVQTRYRETPVCAHLAWVGDALRVRFMEPHLAAPGQSLVVYDNDTCLGGGPISSVVLNTSRNEA